MKKYIIISLSLTILFSLILFLFPINLFEGEIVFSVNGNEFKERAKISLSYFIGVGANKQDMKDVLDFYLLPLGYFNVFLILFVLPILIGYRVKLSDEKKNAT